MCSKKRTSQNLKKICQINNYNCTRDQTVIKLSSVKKTTLPMAFSNQGVSSMPDFSSIKHTAKRDKQTSPA